MGGGGVKNYQKLRDVIYGRPLSKKTKFRTSLPERKSTGNSGPEFPGSGSHFPENTPDFENVTGTHCLM
jgi:hypothetical protein